MMWDMMAPMWCMGLFGVLTLLLIIVGVILVIRSMSGSADTRHSVPSPEQDTAVRILEERYARGEINEDEYQERRRVLHASDANTPET